MELDIFDYKDLGDTTNASIRKAMERALLRKGILGIQGVPNFVELSKKYIEAARTFSGLPEEIKNKYAPLRDTGDTEGYELGAEWFKDENGEWQIDDKKASYYAYVPDRSYNKWPTEVDLKTPYLNMGNLIFKTGKHLLDVLGFNQTIGIDDEKLVAHGRMLHYHKKEKSHVINPNWCGAHLDHSVLTGLMPAYYFQDGKEIEEPKEAGLFIMPTEGNTFEKIDAADKSILLFQIGEFAQLISNDRVKATKHLVRKANDNIERYTLALFIDPDYAYIVNSTSILTTDERYANNQSSDGSLSYEKWQIASYERYRAAVNGK